ncbi:MAG: type II secretion system minor pseudopilin GspK [Pseudomonadota bacterium]
MKCPRNEDGAALLSVLLMVTIMAAIAVAMTDVALRSLSRASAADARGRVGWQITGAEEAGLVAVAELFQTTSGELTIDNPVLGEPIFLEAQGGRISGQVSDASNCFNLNALAGLEDDDGEIEEQPFAVNTYRALLLSLDLSEFEVEALTDALMDWLDSDSTPRIAGAEDAYYLSLSPPYRTGGQPMADVSELRAVLGYESEVVAALEPLVCVRHDSSLGPFNVNTMQEIHAPLMVTTLGGGVTLQEAEDILNRRPFGGWRSLDDFLELESVSRINPELVRTNLIGTATNYVEFRGTAYFGNVSADFATLYSIGEAETVRIARRDRSPR